MRYQLHSDCQAYLCGCVMTLENAVECVHGLWTRSVSNAERRRTSDLDHLYVVSSSSAALFPVIKLELLPFSLGNVWVGTLAAGDVNCRLSVFSAISASCSCMLPVASRVMSPLLKTCSYTSIMSDCYCSIRHI